MKQTFLVMALALAAAACGGEADQAPLQEPANDTETAAPATAAKNEGGLAPCPFRNTSNWRGSIEGGRLLVTGTLDLQMAGMKPQLTQRSGTPGGVAVFDLAMVSEPGAAVTDLARYEKAGSPRYASGEIHCGGERIAAFDMVNL